MQANDRQEGVSAFRKRLVRDQVLYPAALSQSRFGSTQSEDWSPLIIPSPGFENVFQNHEIAKGIIFSTSFSANMPPCQIFST
jgi:hypothetical protein